MIFPSMLSDADLLYRKLPSQSIELLVSPIQRE